jgi:hypothetical protein
MRILNVAFPLVLLILTGVGGVSVGVASRGPAQCDGLTGQKRSKCLLEARRNRSEDDGDAASRQLRPSSSSTSSGSSSAARTEGPSRPSIPSARWSRITVPSPAGFPLYDQLDASDSRLYASREWAEGTDTVSMVARKKLTCLLVVYTMIEHARGNSDYRAGSGTYSDSVGALGIRGIGSSRSLASMEPVRTEFQSGNPVILWGPLTRSPADRFGHFILAIGVDSDGKIVAHDPYGQNRVTIDPATRRVSGSSAISVVEKYRTVRL